MANHAVPWNAADYARHNTAQRKWAEEIIARLNLAGSEIILDIGCGDGQVSASLSEKVPQGRVIGIDSSAAMVKRASHTFDAIKNLTFCQMNAEKIGFDGVFDLAFSNATLHWVEDHTAVLKGVSTALKRGGRLFFQMGGEGNAAEIVAAVDAVREREMWHACFRDFVFPYNFRGVDEYAAWLSQAGLRMTRAELIIKDMTHAGRDGLAGWLRTTWMPYLNRIPTELQADFLEQWLDIYLSRHPIDQEGQTHVQMVRLEVEAVRD